MSLDAKTMFVVTIAVAAVLGLLLFYAWFQQRKVTSLAWWGGSHFVACIAVWLIGSGETLPDFWSIEIAYALLFVAAGMTWMGARVFDGNPVSPVGIFGGATAWLLLVQVTDVLEDPEGPVIFSSMIVAAYTFAAAVEIRRGKDERLMSRLPLTVMLGMHGALYLLRVPVAIFAPGLSSDAFFTSSWFGVMALESLLYMIATAVIFLALAKERIELEQKVAATTDPLTGIPNRRAFLDAAVRSLKQRSRVPQPVSALLFDLDRFKSINDRFGHSVGDRVLRTFADVAVVELRSTDLLGRIGGEEFGALLFGAEAAGGAAVAERIRKAFCATYSSDGVDAEISVSVGVATASADEEIDIESLLERADEALYVAKARGRNRVEIAGGYAPRRQSGRDTTLPQPFPPDRGAGPVAGGALGTIVGPSVVPHPAPVRQVSEVK